MLTVSENKYRFYLYFVFFSFVLFVISASFKICVTITVIWFS